MQIHSVKVPSNNFHQSPSLKFIMTFQRLLIMSIYRQKKIKNDKCQWESGNYRLLFTNPYFLCFFIVQLLPKYSKHLYISFKTIFDSFSILLYLIILYYFSLLLFLNLSKLSQPTIPHLFYY